MTAHGVIPDTNRRLDRLAIGNRRLRAVNENMHRRNESLAAALCQAQIREHLASEMFLKSQARLLTALGTLHDLLRAVDGITSDGERQIVDRAKAVLSDPFNDSLSMELAALRREHDNLGESAARGMRGEDSTEAQGRAVSAHFEVIEAQRKQAAR